jgi:hypothetical protein
MTRPDWRWLTFPVFAAFVFGALIASFLDRPNTDFAVGVRIVLVLLAAYCVIHIVAMYVILPRRVRRTREIKYDEELVYDDEQGTPTP